VATPERYRLHVKWLGFMHMIDSLRASGAFSELSPEKQEAYNKEYATWKSLVTSFTERYCFNEHGLLGLPRVDFPLSSGFRSATRSAIRAGKGTLAMVDIEGRYKVPLGESQASDAGGSRAREAPTAVGVTPIEKSSTLSDAGEATTQDMVS
jgi:hypothetical protein